MKHLRFISFFALAAAFIFAGCTRKAEVKTNDALAEAAAYYKTHPDFFVFATPDDLPQGLKWQHGEGVEPFADPAATRGGVLRDFITDFPRTLRVVGPDSNGSFRGIILDGNALGLLGFHPNMDAAFPSLAKLWAVSPDKTTVYFRLDRDARFSDGEKITAENYFFSFFFFLSSHIHDPWYTNFYSTEYKRITRYDDLTISITLPRARPDFLEKAAGIRPLPRGFYSQLGDDYPTRYQWSFEPTTGPYELLPADLKKGRSITLRYVKNWWAEDKPFYAHRYNPDALQFTVIRDANKAFELFLAGELEMFSLNLPEYWYDRAPASVAVKNGYIQRACFYNDLPRPTWGLYLNTQDTLLKDINVRKGLASSLNWERVLSFFFRGDFERLPGYATGYGLFTDPKVTPAPFDLAAAQKYFEAAGFVVRGADGILRRSDGTRLSVTITAIDGPLSGVLMILKEEALKAGVELNLEILDGTTAFKKVSEKKHQAAFMAFNTAVERFPRFWEMFHSVNAKPQTNNLCQLADKNIDALIDRYDREVDVEEIKNLAYQLQERVAEANVFIPGFMRPWYRQGYWRYVRFPAFFDVRTSSDPMSSGLFWIDEAARAETQAAIAAGKTFDNQIKIFDQWHPKPPEPQTPPKP